MLKEANPVRRATIDTPSAGDDVPSGPEISSIPQTWRVWARELHRLKLETWAAAFLDAAGALTILGAQAIYMSQPLLNRALPESHLTALADLLEEPEQARSFARYLREGDPQ